MIGDYANQVCSVNRPGDLNIYGERSDDSEAAARLEIFMLRESRLVVGAGGWIRPYDARAFIAEGNSAAYTPQLGDKLVFSSGAEWRIVKVKTLKGMGATHLGFRVDLKTITSSGTP